MMKNLTVVAVAVCGLVVAGCGDPGDKSPELTGTAPTRLDAPPATAQAGIGADVDTAPTSQVQAIAAKRNFGSRGDAFSLLPVEKQFDRQQTAARLISDGGGFVDMFTVPEGTGEAPVVTEPLPLWRLSGVVIGDGVAALLDMGGKVIDIRPGMKIPDTDWVVASIDPERAVLRREGNKFPKVFVVPLQGTTGAPAGVGGAGGGGGTAGPRKGGPAGGGGSLGGAPGAGD